MSKVEERRDRITQKLDSYIYRFDNMKPQSLDKLLDFYHGIVEPILLEFKKPPSGGPTRTLRWLRAYARGLRDNRWGVLQNAKIIHRWDTFGISDAEIDFVDKVFNSFLKDSDNLFNYIEKKIQSPLRSWFITRSEWDTYSDYIYDEKMKLEKTYYDNLISYAVFNAARNALNAKRDKTWKIYDTILESKKDIIIKKLIECGKYSTSKKFYFNRIYGFKMDDIIKEKIV